MANILYITPPIKFSFRFWREYRYNLFIGAFFIAAILVFTTEYSAFTGVLCTLIFIATIPFPVIDSRKWALRQLISIAEEDGSYIITVLYKDEEQLFTIKKSDIGTKLKWFGGKQRILTLTVFDKGNIVFKLYSGSKEQMTYELQKMEYVLK